MKLKVTLLFVVLATVTFGQKAIVSSGGSFNNGSGSASITVGQTFSNYFAGSNGSISAGVQKSIEIYTLSTPESTPISINAVMYPNPSKEFINLKIESSSIIGLSYTLYNINGKELKKGKLAKQNTQLNLKNFKAGIYFLRVMKKNKQIKVFKLIKSSL